MTTTAEDLDIVRLVSSAEADRAVATIVMAFVADPVARWAWPDPAGYLSAGPRFVHAFGGEAFEQGSAHYIEDFGGAALWLPPGVEPDAETLQAIIEETVDPDRQETLFAILEGMERHHPTEPHWYLPLIGVEPTRQRRGLGSSLMRHALDRVDRDHLPAYLESSNTENISLYIRHGFEIIGTIKVGTAPPLFPMLRPPR